MVTRMISDALFPDENGKEAPVTWVVSLAHPLVPEMKVVRMFDERDSVEVYSVSADGKVCMRNRIRASRVRLVEEIMPPDVFVEELTDAEGSGLGEAIAPTPAPEAETDAPNGHNASS